MSAPSSAFSSALPGTSPSQKGYPLFPRPFDANAVGGRDATEHLARLQQAVRQECIDWRGAQPAGVTADDRRDSAGWFAASDGAASLAPALAAVDADVADAQAKVDAAVKGQKVDTGDVAAQLAADRYLRRLDRILAPLKGNPAKVIDAFRAEIANADPAQLAVLVEEGPSILESLGAPTDWLNDAVAQKIPGLEDLRTDAALKAKRRDVLAANNAALLRAFNKGTPPPELVDAYGPGITSQPYSNGEPYSPNAD